MFEHYLLPLACLLLNFLAFAACLRFLFSRQGLYWIIPLALTAVISIPNALSLYAVASDSTLAPLRITALGLQPLLLSLLWYAMIVTFHYALKKTIRVNLYTEQVKKNLHEARHLESGERLARERKGRRAKQRKRYRAKLAERGVYSEAWLDLYDTE